MSQEVRQFTVQPDDDGIRLDRWFKRHLPQVGFAMVSRWARTGQVRVDGKRAKPEDRLAAGQVVRVPPGGETSRPQPKKRELTPAQVEQAEAMVILKTEAALVLNKPPGLATQGGTGTHTHVDGLLDAYHDEGEPRPRLVHRLDKDTSGVLLVARTPGRAAFFSRRFSGRSAKKIYWALVVGVPEIDDGTIDAPLAKQPGTGGEKMHVNEESGQAARTRYRVLDRAGNRAAWVELQPLTGRDARLLALADRFEQAVQAVLVHLPHRALELERDVVPSRHLSAVGIPARADISIRPVEHGERRRAGDVPGQRVAAREMEVEGAVPGRDQRHVRDARAIRGLREDHAEADLRDQRFEQGPVVQAEQRIGVHQRLPPLGLLLGAPSVRVRRSPRRALR